VPIFELPLEQLQTYAGRNPKPPGFDAYWSDALRELDGVEPDPRLEPAEFGSARAESFHLWFRGVGGAQVYARYVRPKGEGPHPAVLQFHGYGGHGGDWYPRLGFAAEGIAVAALDVRGQGGRSEDPGGVRGNTLHGHIVRGLEDGPGALFYRSVFLDTVQLARALATLPEIDAGRLGTAGGSQGGALALACAALEPRVKRVAATYPFLSDYRRVWEMDLAVGAYEELRTWFRLFDPRHEREDEVFTTLGHIDVQHLAPRIQGEVLMHTGLMDTVTPPSTQFAAYNKIAAAKRMVVYPDYGHEALPAEPDNVFQFMRGL
jgi:cephalosporin-C deacetylase